MQKRALAVAGAIVTGAAFMLAGVLLAMVIPGAGTAASTITPVPLPKVDLSTEAAVKHYLRSIGVDPRSLVVQRGRKNYAGPNCPGAGWNCTNAQRVMQFGTQNTHECTQTKTDTATSQHCLIIQGPAAKNVAKCVQKKTQGPATLPLTATFFRQRCSISQTGTFNEATIVQTIEQTGDDIQGALQEVGLLQNATASTNRLQVDQEIKQFTEAGTTQDQDAYQVVAGFVAGGASPTGPAQQNAVGRSDNGAQIVQTQIQRAKSGLTQTQNDGDFHTSAPFDEPVDCAMDAPSVANPNACVNLDQLAVNGTNGSEHQEQGQLTQTIDQEATTTKAGVLRQQQGAGPFEGGADARVHQQIGLTGSGLTGTGLTATGTSQNQANQSETLKLWAPPDSNPIQQQFGGARCCGVGSQRGGRNNSEQINQQKSLEAFGGGTGTLQVATLVGSSSSPEDGSGCVVNHSAQTKSDTNSDQATASESRQPCPVLVVLTVCQNTEGEGGPEVGACEEAEVCGPGETPVIVVDTEENTVNVDCDGGNGGPSLAGVTEPVPLSATALDSQNRPTSLSVLRR